MSKRHIQIAIEIVNCCMNEQHTIFTYTRNPINSWLVLVRLEMNKRIFFANRPTLLFFVLQKLDSY